LELEKRALCLIEEARAGGGHPHAAAVSFEQRDAQRVLECAHTAAEHRLPNLQNLGSASKAQALDSDDRLCDRHEIDGSRSRPPCRPASLLPHYALKLRSTSGVRYSTPECDSRMKESGANRRSILFLRPTAISASRVLRNQRQLLFISRPITARERGEKRDKRIRIRSATNCALQQKPLHCLASCMSSLMASA